MRPNGATTTRPRRRTQARLRSQRTDRERLPGLMPGRRRRPTRQPWGAGRENLPAGSAAYSTSFRIFCTESSCSRS